MNIGKISKEDRAEIGAGGALIGIIIVVVIIAAVAWASFIVVPRGERGVVDTFGQVDDNALMPDSYLFWPWRHIEKTNIQTQQYEFKGIEDTLTKEGLKVRIDASVVYRNDPTQVVVLYKNVRGDPFEILLVPNFMSILRDEVKRWSAEDIYTGKSTDIQFDVERRLRDILAPRGIIIEAVLFRGLKLPDRVTDAIELKLSEKQAVETMNFTVEKQKLESRRVVIEANGTAAANEIVSKSITPELIQWNFVQGISNNKNVIYVPIGGLGGSSGGSIILPAQGKNQ